MAIQTLPDGGYILVGDYNIGSIIRTNAQGDSLWSKRLGGGTNTYYLNAVAAVSDGFIAAGSKNARPYAIKLDVNGNTVWEHYVGGTTDHGEVNGLVVAADGIAFTGYLYAGTNYNMLVAKFSLAGDSLWMKAVSAHTTTSGTAITGASGNSIIVAGSGFVIAGTADREMYMVRTDAAGNIVWDRNYGGVHSPSDRDEAKCVRPTADGGYIVCGGKAASSASYDTQIALIKTSSDGTRVWQQALPGMSGFGHQLYVETDGYTLAASVGGSVSTGHIIKTDLLGSIVYDLALTADYAIGLDRGQNGSFTVVGTWQSAGGMYLGNITGKAAGRHFVILESNGDPIPNKEVILYKGTMHPGNDIRVSAQTTDADGKITIDPSWYRSGDSIRVVFTAAAVPTQKPLHQDSIIQGVAYRILLDNVKFDEQTTLPKTKVSFDIYSNDPAVTEQRITLDHTTLVFDLMMSIEWDAASDYTNAMQSGIKMLSNYLFDVFDGQVALGKVEIWDDKANWNGADVCFTASTETWPHAGLRGFRTSSIGENQQTFMPPRWIGSPARTRDNESSATWLAPYDDPWRTLGHELGHQLFGFLDEYKDAAGANIVDTLNGPYNLGYMCSQYKDTLGQCNTPLDGVYSSELSSPTRYRLKDRITRQYVLNGGDCWTYLKQQFEGTYNGVFCPIVEPSERKTLAAGATYMLGPNDKSYVGSPYDVSSMVRFSVVNKNTSLDERVFSIYIPATPTNTPANLVQAYLTKKSSGRVINLGLTGKTGQIRMLGAETGDAYSFTGNVGGTTKGQAVALNGTLAIRKTDGASIQSADTSVVLNLVAGNYAVVPVAMHSGPDGILLKLVVNNAFAQAPVAIVPFDNGVQERVPYVYDAARHTYSGTFDSLPSQGSVLTTAYDAGSAAFLIPMKYATSAFSSDVYGDNGGVWITLDSANKAAIQNTTVISSRFAPLHDGLESDAVQGGNVHAIVLGSAAATLAGSNALTIRYSPDELAGHAATSLRLHKWNETAAAWENIGGSVDTAHAEVNGAITSGGTYAAFTTSGMSGVMRKDGTIPEFALSAITGTCGTTVVIDLARQDNVEVNITNSLGATVGQLASGIMSAGAHEFRMDASLPSGVYFCTASTRTVTKTVKITLYR